MYMLVQAAENAGGTDTASLVKGMTGMSFTGVGGDITLDENGDAIKSIAINTYIDGEVKWTETHWGGGKRPRPLRLGKGNGPDDFLTVFSKPDKRLKPGRNLCADCLGLHNGLRHYPHDQLRPR